MRIVSLLPASTEILYAIGAGDSVVGVTHECDFPPDAARKPKLIRPRVDPSAAPAELDRQVRELVERGESIYAVDAELLDQPCAGPDRHAGPVPCLRRFARRPRQRACPGCRASARLAC